MEKFREIFEEVVNLLSLTEPTEVSSGAICTALKNACEKHKVVYSDHNTAARFRAQAGENLVYLRGIKRGAIYRFDPKLKMVESIDRKKMNALIEDFKVLRMVHSTGASLLPFSWFKEHELRRGYDTASWNAINNRLNTIGIDSGVTLGADVKCGINGKRGREYHNNVAISALHLEIALGELSEVLKNTYGYDTGYSTKKRFIERKPVAEIEKSFDEKLEEKIAELRKDVRFSTVSDETVSTLAKNLLRGEGIMEETTEETNEPEAPKEELTTEQPAVRQFKTLVRIPAEKEETLKAIFKSTTLWAMCENGMEIFELTVSDDEAEKLADVDYFEFISIIPDKRVQDAVLETREKRKELFKMEQVELELQNKLAALHKDIDAKKSSIGSGFEPLFEN